MVSLKRWIGCAALANRPFGDNLSLESDTAGGNPMTDSARQMPEHVGAAYQDAVDNIRFFKRQQWLATNYALLVYAAIFIISAHYFSRTDFARNLLGLLTIVTFGVHWYMMNVLERAITKFRDRLRWIYRTYFSDDERVGLALDLGQRPQPEVFISLLAVSLIGAVLTAIYLWSVRWYWRGRRLRLPAPRRRKGQADTIVLRRLMEALGELSSDLRRDTYIFIAAIVFLVVTYLLAQWLA
jgi:hypothetical protein